MRAPPLLAAALALGLGCGAFEDERAARPKPRGADEEAGEQREASAPIVIALRQLPRKFDPHDDMEPWAARVADDLLFEGLVRRTGDAWPWAEPALADECVIDPDYGVTMISCHIPRGIRFHDGSEVGMDDVEYSLRYWLHERRGWLRDRFGLSSFSRLELVDGPRNPTREQRDRGRWVRLIFAKREPLALEALAAIKIVPIAAHKGRGDRFAQAPVGTGPMRMATLAADRIELVRFDGYREDRPGAPGKITLRAINDGAEALTALRRGEVHVLTEVAPHHVPVELGKPGMAGRFSAWLVSPADYDVLLWYLGKGLSADLGVRSALHDAIPRAAIARELYGSPGLNVEAPVDLHSPTPIDLFGLQDILPGEPVPDDLPRHLELDGDRAARERASAQLDRLGWPRARGGMRRRPGGPLRVNVARADHEGLPALVSEEIRAAWEELGVRAPDSVTSWRFMFAMLSQGKFRVALVRMGGPSDEDLSPLFHSRGALNFSGVEDGQLDEALREYAEARDRVERDAAKRRLAQRLAELRVVSVIHAPAQVLLASRRLGGIEFVDDMPRLDLLRLDPGDLDWAQVWDSL